MRNADLRAQKAAGSPVVISMFGNAFPPFAALVTAPVLAQGLGVEARGEVAAAQAVALLAVSVTAFGFPEAITYFIARGVLSGSRAASHLVAFTAVSGALATILVIRLSGWLGGDSSAAPDLITLAALSIPPSLLLGLIRGRAAGHGMWHKIAAERVVGSCVRLAGAVGLLMTGALDARTATALLAFGPLVGALPYLLPMGPRQTVRQLESTTNRALGSYSGRIWLGMLSGILLMRIDQALLVPLAGATALGIYAVAVSLSEVPLVVNSAFRDVAFTEHAGEFDVDKLVETARRSALASSAVAVAIAALLPWGIPTLFGAEFDGAVPVTAVLLFAVVAGTPGSIAGAGLAAIGQPGRRSLAWTAAASVNVVVLLALAPPWGAMGAAVATLIGNLVSSNLNILWCCRATGAAWRSFYVMRLADISAVAGISGRLFNRRSFSKEMP